MKSIENALGKDFKQPLESQFPEVKEELVYKLAKRGMSRPRLGGIVPSGLFEPIIAKYLLNTESTSDKANIEKELRAAIFDYLNFLGFKTPNTGDVEKGSKPYLKNSVADTHAARTHRENDRLEREAHRVEPIGDGNFRKLG